MSGFVNRSEAQAKESVKVVRWGLHHASDLLEMVSLDGAKKAAIDDEIAAAESALDAIQAMLSDSEDCVCGHPFSRHDHKHSPRCASCSCGQYSAASLHTEATQQEGSGE